MSDRIAGAQLLAEGIAEGAALVRRLLGTADATEVEAVVADFCLRALGAPPGAHELCRASVGVVFGLRLADGRRVVVKLHRPEVGATYLGAVQEVQRLVAARGLPAPRPLVAPTRVRDAIATAETMLDDGRPPDPYDARHRDLMARALARFVVACADAPDRAALRSWQEPARGKLWPPPHDVRFDFGATAAGAEWIDALGACALALTRRGGDAPVVGHGDWRREHLRIHDGRLAAIYDWDSVHLASESAIAAGAMRCFPADWTAGPDHRQYPSLSEMRAFLSAYEDERGRRFEGAALQALNAALVYGAAYTARCEHSDRCTDFGAAPARVLPPAAPPGSMSAFLMDHAEALLGDAVTPSVRDAVAAARRGAAPR